MGLKSKPGKNTAKKLVIPDANAAREVNSNEAGSALGAKLANVNTITYDNKDIMLSDIRLNPDNELFRKMDDEEDIKILAEDIERSGLMHNLVVFPELEDKKTVYVLLSGERRYRALKYLEEKGDATWNTVKNCNVITTKLSENEKKVLLYSANLQVRGGFGDEAIRRTAIAEFVRCLQMAPYNLSEAQAKKAIKEISPQNAKTTEKDLRVEWQLNAQLKDLLNKKFLSRSECEVYLRFSEQQQQELALLFQQLHDVDCCSNSEELAGKNYIEVLRDDIHNNVREELVDSQKKPTYKEMDEAYKQAVAEFRSSLEGLEQKAAEYKAAQDSQNASEVEEIEHEGRKEAAKQRVQNTYTTTSAVQKCAPKTIKALSKLLNNKKYAKGLAAQDQKDREEDIASLTELIETATELKSLIEAAGN